MAKQELSLAQQTAGKVKAYLESNKDAVMRSLPKGFNYDRMCRTVINAISTTPTLAECTPTSIFLSTVKAFSMGLEPNGAFGHAYLVPFNNTDKRCKEAQFMPGYRGLTDLARRSGKLSKIFAREVYEKDEFNVNAEKIDDLHKFSPFDVERGKVIGYYAVFKFRDSSDFDFETMSLKEVEKIRNSSPGKNSPAWKLWFDEMGKKSVLKRLLKRAPMSIENTELEEAIQKDHQVSMGVPQDNTIDIEGVTIEDSEDEMADSQKAMNDEKKDELKKKLEQEEMDIMSAGGEGVE